MYDRNNLTGRVIGCAIEAHRHLGPGLLESAYQQSLTDELRLCGINFRTKQLIPLEYNGVRLDYDYRIDLIIEDEIILELKSVNKLLPVHEAHLLTSMRLSKTYTGLLINFNTHILKNGIERFAL